MFWLFLSAGLYLSVRIGKINLPLGLLMFWGFFIGFYDVMYGRASYNIVSGDLIWPIALSALFLLAYDVNDWTWLARPLVAIVFIHIVIATWLYLEYPFYLVDFKSLGLVKTFATNKDAKMVGLVGNQPNLAHLIAISLPLLAGTFWPLIGFGLFLVPLKSSIAALSAGVGLIIWKPKIMLPVVMGLFVAMLAVDPLMLPRFKAGPDMKEPTEGSYRNWNLGDMERLYIWKEASIMAAETPFLGRGIGTYKRQFWKVSYEKNITPGEVWLHPQNELVRLFYEIGMLGPVLALLAGLWTLVRAWRAKINMALLGGFAAVLVSSLGYEITSMPSLVAISALIWGMAESGIRRQENDHKGG